VGWHLNESGYAQFSERLYLVGTNARLQVGATSSQSGIPVDEDVIFSGNYNNGAGTEAGWLISSDGYANFYGNVLIDGDLTVSGSALVNTNLVVGDDTAGSITVGTNGQTKGYIESENYNGPVGHSAPDGSATAGWKIYNDGTAEFADAVYVGNLLKIGKNGTAGNIESELYDGTADSSGFNLNYDGTAHFGSSVSVVGNITVGHASYPTLGSIASQDYDASNGWKIFANGDADFNGDLNVGGNVYLSNTTGGIVQVGASLATPPGDQPTADAIFSANYSPAAETGWGIEGDGDANFYGNLLVGGDTTLDGALTVGIGSLKSDNHSGVVGQGSIGWMLTGEGIADFGSDLYVSGNSYFTGDTILGWTPSI
jgi:hypothetical protein